MLPLDQQNRYREQYKAIRRGWRPSGESYEAMIRDVVVRSAPQTLTVLDIGAGAGGVLELLSIDLRLSIGLDLDFAALRRSRNPSLRRLVGRAEMVPIRRASVDAVICTWVLEHLPAPLPVFQEFQRILKPGGHLFFLTPNAANPIVSFNRLVPTVAQTRLVRWLYRRAADDTFPVQYRANTLATLTNLARQAAFEIVELTPIPDPTYLAFTPLLFRLSVAFEKLIPPRRAVHLVGHFTKRT